MVIIDCSSNNGHIDFALVKPQVDKVIIRATMGTGTADKNAPYYAQHCKDNGIPVSYYHFAYPDKKMGGTIVSDATSEANYFLQTIKPYPDPVDLIIDCEPKNAAGDDTDLTQSEYALWLQTFLDVVEHTTGKKMVIYTYADYLNRHLPIGHTFGNFPLWIANYGKNIKCPPLPHGWLNYYMWQYSQSGSINGISTPVDLSVLNKTL